MVYQEILSGYNVLVYDIVELVNAVNGIFGDKCHKRIISPILNFISRIFKVSKLEDSSFIYPLTGTIQ